MEKLKIGHIKNYLDYGLKIAKGLTVHQFLGVDVEDKENIFIKLDILNENDEVTDGMEHVENVKPILRSLSDYKDINSEAMNDLNMDLEDQIQLSMLANQNISLAYCYQRMVECSYRHHIDLNNLIPKGLAIDKNTI